LPASARAISEGECVKSGMDYWNTGMVEWKIVKVYYEFLHLNIP